MSRLLSYSIGLVLAIVLTLAAFALTFVHIHILPGQLPSVFLLPAILGLAFVQLVVQLVCFLHLGQDEDSKWNATLFCMTLFGILVIVVASLWIMNHLNHNMTPQQVNQYINDQSSF